MRTMLILILGVMCGACMLEPANETALGSQRERVEFRGVAAVPRATIRIQAAAAPDGPFAQIASGQASGAPTLIGGALVYEFSISAFVPIARWASTCDGSETFVRALARALVLTTYDSEEIAGISAGECIADAIGAGSPFVAAATVCASEFGAPARLTAPQGGVPGTVLARNLTIVNPYQSEDYGCLTEVDGDLRILDPSNLDLAFPALTSVSGTLEARYGRALADNEARLIDLPELASVGGDLELESLGPTSGGLLTIEFGMPALTEVGGAIAIEFQGKGSGFDSIRGLAALASHEGDLSVLNLRELDTGYGSLLPELASVDGDVTLDLGLTCSGALPALQEISGNFEYEVATMHNGLPVLAEVGGDAAISLGIPVGGDLPGLASVGGSLAVTWGTPAMSVPYLESLADVDGELGVFDSEGPPVVPGSVPLSVGSLRLDGNPGLEDLAASLAHVSLAPNGAVTIVDNPNVTDCEAQDWVDSLPGNVGPVTISGNGGC